MQGLILAAPASGSGKTTLTLGILRALHQRGHDISSAKSGPDYIDPAFHAAATGRPCVNLDAWGMTQDQIRNLANSSGDLIIEGAMGLFDGAPPNGKGACADLARILGLPVVLVVDARAMSHSVAALVSGFLNFDPAVRICGVILNQVGSPRHAAMLRHALDPLGLPVLGAVPRYDALARPSRHLGLIQAGEMPDLDDFLDKASQIVEQHIDLGHLRALMTQAQIGTDVTQTDLTLDMGFGLDAPKKIALAQDAAFSFIYPHHIAAWKAAGAAINRFSPLKNEPVPEADLVFLPGGYPELHAAQLSQNNTFMQSLKEASQESDIYGECGGYMTLGETLIDAHGTAHKMAGLLGLVTSFADRKLHLGYRHLSRHPDARLAPGSFLDGQHTAHEFHYATTIRAEGTPLFMAQDAEGHDLGAMGLCEGRVAGSFAHIIAARHKPRQICPIAPTSAED